MTEKNRIQVRIGGKEYTLVGTETDEYMQRLALYVDKRLAEILRMNNKLSTSAAAILTSVNMADQLLKSKESIENLENELIQLKQELDKYKNENKRLLEENTLMVNKNTSLQMDLVKKEAELNETRNVLERAAK